MAKKTETRPEAEAAIYTAAELAEAASNIFGREVMPECVRAAFAFEGKEEATVDEAKAVVSRFLRREIK